MSEWEVDDAGVAPFNAHQYASDFLKDKGWEPHHIAGIVGNLDHESAGMNPDAVSKDGMNSYGLAQWTGPRKRQLFSYAASKNENHPSLHTQLEFLDWELNNTESDAANALKRTKDFREATQVFSQTFERPSKPLMESRLKRAGNIFSSIFGPSEAYAAEGPQDMSGWEVADEGWTPTDSAQQGQPPATQPPTDVPQTVQTEPTAEIKSAIPEAAPQWAKDNPSIYYAVADAVKAAETPGDFAALLAGGKIGATAGGAAGTIAPGPGNAIGALAGGLAGAGLAYAAKKYGMDAVKQYLGIDKPTTLEENVTKAPGRVAEGVTSEAIGLGAGKVLGGALKTAGKVVKPVLGRMSGTGTAAVEEALKVGETVGKSDFTKAMRGKITPQEIVDNAKEALMVVKEDRGIAYRAKLDKIKNIPTKMNAIKAEVEKTADELISPNKYDIDMAYNNKGGLEFDFSKSTLVEGQPVVKRALEDVYTWTDTTPKGLDVLKRRLSTYIDQTKAGTPAEAFLTKLEKSLDQQLKQQIPGYYEMTKGYSEATQLIKDIEAGLMLRKQGMTGRVVADQTLRRLTSAMKDNFELRRELVGALSSQSGKDLSGQVAGQAMGKILPHGLAGTGPALIGQGALAVFSPKFIPILVASSPRVQGEFLRVFGRGLRYTRGGAKAAGKLGGYAASKPIIENVTEFEEDKD